MFQRRFKFIVIGVIVLVAAVASFVNRDTSARVAEQDATELGSPLLAQALRMEDAGQIEPAIELYRKAQAVDPDAARPHLHLAFLLHDVEKDYVTALYHYKRYLAMRPLTEKSEMIAARVDEARKAFAAEIYERPPELVAELAAAQQETGLLKAEIRRLSRERDEALEDLRRARVRLATPPTTTTTTTTSTSTTRPPVQRLPTQYKVRQGDNLSLIAERFYGDRNMYIHILKANRRALRGGDQIRVGQTLTIPAAPQG